MLTQPTCFLIFQPLLLGENFLWVRHQVEDVLRTTWGLKSTFAEIQMVNPIFIRCNLFLITLSNSRSASLSSPFTLVPRPIRTNRMSGGGLEPTSVMWRAWWRHTHPSFPGMNRNEVNLNHHLVSHTRDVELWMNISHIFYRFKVHYKSSCVYCSTDKDCDCMSYLDSSRFCLPFCDKANILLRYRPF